MVIANGPPSAPTRRERFTPGLPQSVASIRRAASIGLSMPWRQTRCEATATRPPIIRRRCPGIPSVLYFTEDGDAIHGTYWHDTVVTQESQVGVNLTVADGAYLFNQTGVSTPVMILD
jgi:hypothetical protein